MGDFQDIFGTSADIDAIIDSIQPDDGSPPPHDAPPPKVRLHFDTLDQAEDWVRRHPDRRFVRRPMLDGFEVELLEGKSAFVQRDQMHLANRGLGRPVDLLILPDEDPAFSSDAPDHLEMAVEVDGMAAEVLRALCDYLPGGRARQLPLHLTADELYDFCWSMPARVTYLIDAQHRTVFIGCEDHSALIGTFTDRGTVLIEPWIFEVPCNYFGETRPLADEDCFLCRHFQFDEMKSFNTQLYSEGPLDMHSSTPLNEVDFRRPRALELMAAIRDWRRILESVDAGLSETRLPPALATCVLTDDIAVQERARVQCALIAQAAIFKAEWDKGRVVLSIVRPTQFRGPDLALDFRSRGLQKREAITVSSSDRLDANFPSGSARDLISCRATPSNHGVSLPGSGMSIYVEFDAQSAHQKMAALDRLRQVESVGAVNPIIQALLDDALRRKHAKFIF